MMEVHCEKCGWTASVPHAMRQATVSHLCPRRPRGAPRYTILKPKETA